MEDPTPEKLTYTKEHSPTHQESMRDRCEEANFEVSTFEENVSQPQVGGSIQCLASDPERTTLDGASHFLFSYGYEQ